MELYEASCQWASRPDDQRFESLAELFKACKGYHDRSREKTVNFRSLVTKATKNGELIVYRDEAMPAFFTHFGFGQFCKLTRSPAAFLRTLPPEMASDVLNNRIQNTSLEDVKMLVQGERVAGNNATLVRAVTSEIYERIWNYEVADWAMNLVPRGWRVPPARPARSDQKGIRRATSADVIDVSSFGLSVKEGDLIAPAGLYASDHDLFIFLINPGYTIEAAAGGRETINRGCFWKNNEVGSGSLVITTFLYEHVCGNHIVWGASNVKEARIRHVGSEARDRCRLALQKVREYMDSGTYTDAERIRAARSKEIAKAKPETVDFVFEKRILSKQNAESAYDIAEAHAHIHGSPRSYWGFASGITRLSQSKPYADEREELDRAAQKLLAMAF